MTQQDLINRINQRLSTTYGSNVNRVKSTLAVLAEVATETLTSGGEVPFLGLGKLVVVATKERTGRNPRTGTPVQIEAGRKAKFTAGKALKDALKG